MGWVLLNQRICELQRSVSNREYEKMAISRLERQLSSYSSAIADGFISQDELSSFGSELFGVALDFSANSSMYASDVANAKIDEYQVIFENAVANGAASSQLQGYMNSDGSLNYDLMYQEFYKEALADFSNNVVMPQLNEIQKTIDNKKLELETLSSAEANELQALKDQKSNSIQQSTIRLA